MGSKPFPICSDVPSILPALVNFHPQLDEQGEGGGQSLGQGAVAVGLPSLDTSHNHAHST